MIKNITADEVRRMAGDDGLILQGCGGDPKEWQAGINEMLAEAGILQNGGGFRDISVFEHEGITNMLFSFDSVEPADLDIGKLAVWRLQTHGSFGGTWLSDYIENRLGVDINDRNPELEGITPEQAEPPAWRPMQAYIENANDARIGGFTIVLPTTQEELQRFLDDMEITDWSGVKIWEIESSMTELGDRLTAYAEENPAPDLLNELNYLAARIAGLDNEGLEIFAANIEAGRNCGSVAEMLDLTFEENLSRFDIQPSFDAETYGEFLLDMAMHGEENAAIFNRLNESKDPAERAFAAHIEKLEAHVDREALARTAAIEEGGVFTGAGYLTGGDGLQKFYRGAIDIPAEYRLTIAAPAEREQRQMSVMDEIRESRNKPKAHAPPAPGKNKLNRGEGER